jgi:hypothetical protein
MDAIPEKKRRVSEKSLANLTQRGKGRPPGVKNKFTNLKNAFLNVFHEMGGEEWLKQRASDHKRGASEFMQALIKMLPTKIDADLSGNLSHSINIIDYSTVGKKEKKKGSADAD